VIATPILIDSQFHIRTMPQVESEEEGRNRASKGQRIQKKPLWGLSSFRVGMWGLIGIFVGQERAKMRLRVDSSRLMEAFESPSNWRDLIK